MAFNIVAGVNNAVYGSVSGSGSYAEGAEVTLEVTANDGYRFVSWDDGSTDNPRIFNASEDVTLVATLEAIPEYAISVTTNDNSLGTVSGSGTFREGTSIQISASPYVHSRFVNWEDGNSDNPRTVTVSAATTYKAIFEAVSYFTISTDVNDANLGSVTGAGDYDEGDTVTLTAVPETDCRFVSWNDGNTDNPRIFTSSADVTYTATFEEIQYTDVTIASNDVSWGTVSGATSGNIETGTTITLTATPAIDYKFDGWQVDGDIVSVSPTASFLVDGQEMDIIAVFSAIVFYQVTLITNDVECGSISVVSATAEPKGEAHNIWPDGTIINLQAVTTAGGKFLNWSTGQVATEITVNVHGNETIRANFYPATGLILVTKKILQQTWSTIKSFFSASTGASKIGAPANNALGATTLADVVNSVGQPDGIALLNTSGKVAAADIDGTLSNDTTGNAATATTASQLGTTTVGATDTPIYLNAGTPTACGGSLAVDITGNAATATSATTAVSCSGNSVTATSATNVDQLNGSSNYNRPVLLSGLTNITTTTNQSLQTVFSNKVYVNPSTGILTATGFSGPLTGNVTGNCSGSSGSCTGNAATATTASSVSRATFGNSGAGEHNCNNIKSNGLWYYSSNGPATTLGASTTDGALYSQAYNTSWCGQIAQDYRNGRLFVRGLNNGTWKDWMAILDSGNYTTYTVKKDGTGASGSWGISVTGSSASCTGNAASATYATNIRVTDTDSNTWYPLVFSSGSAANTNYAARVDADSILVYPGVAPAAKTQGNCYLQLGNAKATATAGNKRGRLRIFGANTSYTEIVSGVATTARTFTLPDIGGLAVVSSDSTVYNISVVTALPSSPNAKTIYLVK